MKAGRPSFGVPIRRQESTRCRDPDFSLLPTHAKAVEFPQNFFDNARARCGYRTAQTAYQIPNAMVGYQPGYGAVFDDYPQDSSGQFTRLRLVALCAVKNDYALIAAASGPYHEFTPDYGTGHPSGANLALALDMGKYINSFRWHSEPTT